MRKRDEVFRGLLGNVGWTYLRCLFPCLKILLIVYLPWLFLKMNSGRGSPLQDVLKGHAWPGKILIIGFVIAVGIVMVCIVYLAVLKSVSLVEQKKKESVWRNYLYSIKNIIPFLKMIFLSKMRVWACLFHRGRTAFVLWLDYSFCPVVFVSKDARDDKPLALSEKMVQLNRKQYFKYLFSGCAMALIFGVPWFFIYNFCLGYFFSQQYFTAYQTGQHLLPVLVFLVFCFPVVFHSGLYQFWKEQHPGLISSGEGEKDA